MGATLHDTHAHSHGGGGGSHSHGNTNTEPTMASQSDTRTYGTLPSGVPNNSMGNHGNNLPLSANHVTTSDNIAETALHVDTADEQSDSDSRQLLISDDKKDTAHKENINVRAAFIHVIGDLLQSIGVLIAALLVYFKVCVPRQLRL